MALRLLQISSKSRLLIHQHVKVIGILGPRHFSDDSTKDDDIVKSRIELSHPKGKQMLAADVGGSSTSSGTSSGTSDSESDSDSSSSSDSETESLGPQMVSAAGDVAKALGGDTKQTASDLLTQLRSHHKLTKDRLSEQLPLPDITNVIDGMKVQRQRQRSNWKLAEEGATSEAKGDVQAGGTWRRRLDDGQSQGEASGSSEYGILGRLLEKKGHGQGQLGKPRQRQDIPLTLFGGQALGIFPNVTTTKVPTRVVPDSLFGALGQAELKAATTMPAENAFDEQIRWTHEGKLWTFPIDNEQGLEDEKKVGFHEHIFLESQITDFPRKGPVRHFMELVCVGLSKNPYLTVAEKHEHIAWFRKYFSEKKHILDEVIIDSSTMEKSIGSGDGMTPTTPTTVSA